MNLISTKFSTVDFEAHSGGSHRGTRLFPMARARPDSSKLFRRLARSHGEHGTQDDRLADGRMQCVEEELEQLLCVFHLAALCLRAALCDRLGCRGLRNKDTFSKSDPVCILSQKMKNGKWAEIARTETIQNDLNPKYVRRFSSVLTAPSITSRCLLSLIVPSRSHAYAVTDLMCVFLQIQNENADGLLLRREAGAA
eukprot:3922182-Rhodomonas_salina.1